MASPDGDRALVWALSAGVALAEWVLFGDSLRRINQAFRADAATVRRFLEARGPSP